MRATNVAVSPNSHECEIAQAPILIGVPFKVVTRINDVVYRIQRNPRSRTVVHLDRFAPYHVTAAALKSEQREQLENNHREK
jgi:phenylpyruvate tautomerase PptA (4-oxalocrotonate tautomerase family)